jgi:hypothetical protein
MSCLQWDLYIRLESNWSIDIFSFNFLLTQLYCNYYSWIINTIKWLQEIIYIDHIPDKNLDFEKAKEKISRLIEKGVDFMSSRQSQHLSQIDSTRSSWTSSSHLWDNTVYSFAYKNKYSLWRFWKFYIICMDNWSQRVNLTDLPSWADLNNYIYIKTLLQRHIK